MRVVAVACQGPTQETSRDHRIHGPRIPGKWCERSRSGLALEVVYVGGPWRYFWRFPTLGHRGGISLGQCKSCCMIWLPLNLFQERRCYVFFPFMLYTFYMFVEDTLRLSWADQNQDWLRFTWWLDCCMLLLRSLWGKALWFWHRQSFNYWGGLTGRPSGSASPWTYVPPVYCPHCALVTLHMAALLHMTKKQ